MYIYMYIYIHTHIYIYIYIYISIGAYAENKVVIDLIKVARYSFQKIKL